MTEDKQKIEDKQKNEDKQKLALKSYSELLRDGFKLFYNNYLKIILPFLVFQILGFIIVVFLFTDLQWALYNLEPQMNVIFEKINNNPYYNPSDAEYRIMDMYILLGMLILLKNLVINVFYTIAMCSVSSYLFKKYIREKSDLNDEFKKSFNKNLIKVIIIVGIFALFPFYFIIPLIILGFYAFSIYTYNDDKIENPMSEAHQISKGSAIKIIGVFFISYLITMIVSSIIIFILDTLIVVDNSVILSWYNPATRNYGMIIIYNLMYYIVDILLAPLFICLLTPLFSSLKARKELGPQYKPRYLKYQPRPQAPYNSPYGAPYQQQPYPYYQQPMGYPQAGPMSPQPMASSYGMPQPISPQQQSGIFCPFCGHKIITLKSFCPECGRTLEHIND